MKLISINADLFQGNNNKISSFLQKEQADIFCFQEVAKKVSPKSFAKYISYNTIVDATPELEFQFYSPTWILSVFKKDNFHGKDHFEIDLGGDVEFGQLTKSALPIIKAENIYVQGNFRYSNDFSNWPDDDSRAFQVIDLEYKRKQLRIINYHGIWSKDKKDSDRSISACRKIATYASIVENVIICGDFNLFPNTESINILNKKFPSLIEKFQIQSTRPNSNYLSDSDRNVVDYMFASNNISVNKFKVLQSNVSDHLPLSLEFDII